MGLKIPVDSFAEPPEWVAYQVPPERAGLRLDAFLSQCLHWRSRNQVQGLIEGNKIRLNGKKPKKSSRVLSSDRIEIKVPPPATKPRPDLIPIDILYEDRWLLALNKPPGVVCHPVGEFQYETLVNALHYQFQKIRGEDIRPQLCHRLDRETSGVLLIAKSPEVRALVQRGWERREVEKRYLAVVHGTPRPDCFRVELPLAAHPESPGGLKVCVCASGREAMTEVQVLERFSGHALIELSILTGRQHQIRAHMAHRGHPLLCDFLYGNARGDAPARWRPEQQSPEGPGGLCRQALHASFLAMKHPMSTERLELSAPLARDMRVALDYLRREERP